MVVLLRPSAGEEVRAVHVTQILDLLTGVSGGGTPLSFIDATDTTNYALTVGNQDTTNGRALKLQYGPVATPTVIATFAKSGISLLSADGTQGITINNSGVTITGNFLVFNVKSYGAVGDGTTNDTSAIQSAIAAAGTASNGSIVYFPAGTYYVTSTLTVSKPGVHLVGPGRIDQSINPKTILKLENTAVPGITFGGLDTDSIGAGSFCSIRNLCIQYNTVPVADTGGIGSAILLDRVGKVSSSVVNGRFLLDNVQFESCRKGIQVGTSAFPFGCAEVTIRECGFNVTHDAIIVQGAGYLFVERNNAGETDRANQGAFIILNGASTQQPDSMIVVDNFTEDFYSNIRINHTAGSVGNSLISRNTFDGTNIGIWAQTSSTINGLTIDNNTINSPSSGTNDAADLLSVANTYGILFEPSGSNGGIRIINNTIQRFGRQAVHFANQASATVTDIHIAGNTLHDNAKEGAGTGGSIYIGNNLSRVVVRNNWSASAGATHKPTHILTVGTGVANYVFEGNIGLDVATAAIQKTNLTPNSTTAIVRDNYGPVSSGDMHPGTYLLLGPFHLAGATATATMLVPTSNGTTGDAANFIAAPFNGRVIGLTVSATANIAGAGANVTWNGTIAGSNTTLSANIVTADSLDRRVATQTSGDTFTQSQKLGVGITVTGTLTANDFTAWLMVVPT